MDLTLQSDLYNNIKFNMQKLILEVEDNDVERLSQIFSAPQTEINKFLTIFHESVNDQVAAIKNEMEIPQIHGKKKIVFIGDSITSDRESYLNILKKIYEETTEVEFIDAAVSGDKSDDAVMKFYFRALKFQPDIAHILIGTNDMRENNDENGDTCISFEEYRRNLEYMIEELQERNCIILLTTIPPIHNTGIKKRFPEDNWVYKTEKIKQLNEIICEIANKYNVKLNDMRKIYSEYDATEILFRDGLHLNQKGQQLLTCNVLKALAEYL